MKSCLFFLLTEVENVFKATWTDYRQFYMDMQSFKPSGVGTSEATHTLLLTCAHTSISTTSVILSAKMSFAACG